MTFSKSLLACSLAALLCFSAQPAQAALLTFDSFDGLDLQSVSNGYGGLDWTNIRAKDTSGDVSGYANGTISKKNVAFNGHGTAASFSSSTAFTLNSAYFTAALADGLQLSLTGFLNGNSLYSSTLTLDTYGPTFVTFDWGSVDKVTLTTSGGVDHGYDGYEDGKQFALDNMTINAVPLPAALPLFGLGVAGLAAYRRRKAS